jgi:hypothetical protein
MESLAQQSTHGGANERNPRTADGMTSSGRDPDSLAWERARDEDLRRAQGRDLDTSLERLELKCRNLLDAK